MSQPLPTTPRDGVYLTRLRATTSGYIAARESNPFGEDEERAARERRRLICLAVEEARTVEAGPKAPSGFCGARKHDLRALGIYEYVSCTGRRIRRCAQCQREQALAYYHQNRDAVLARRRVRDAIWRDLDLDAVG